MQRCPYCSLSNVTHSLEYGISKCMNCGSEFRQDTVFKEGSYKTFMSNVLSRMAENSIPATANILMDLKNNMLNNKDDVDLIMEKLIDVVERVNTGNVLGTDRKHEVISLVEGLETISSFVNVLIERNELDDRIAHRIKMIEGISDFQTQPVAYPPEEIPELPGEIVDPISADDEASLYGDPMQQQPVASNIITATDPSLQQQPQVDPLQFATEWAGHNVDVVVEEGPDGVVKYSVTENGNPLISWNEDTKCHEGIENFSEEQLSELDGIISEKKVNPWAVCTASAGRDDKDKYERCVMDVKKQQGMAQEGTVTATEGSPADKAAQITANSGIAADKTAATEEAPVDNTLDKTASVELINFIKGSCPRCKSQYDSIVKNLKNKQKRGVYNSDLAAKAFGHVVATAVNNYGDKTAFPKQVRMDVAATLRNEFEGSSGGGDVQAQECDVNGPIGEPTVNAAPEVDGPIGKPLPEENDEMEVLAQPLDAEVGEVEAEESPEHKEHEEKEQKLIDKIESKAEGIANKVDSIQNAVDSLKDTVEKITDLEREERKESKAGEEAGESEEGVEGEESGETEEPEEDELGDVSEVEPEGETLEEMDKSKTKSGHELVKKPEVIKTTRAIDGEAPSGHIVKYVSSKHDPSKAPNEQWTEEETPIPLTQAEAEKGNVDEKGEKNITKNSAKDANKDSYTKDKFMKNRPNAKMEESTRFNGYRVGDRIKVPGHSKSFVLTKITLEPVKFHLTEGITNITLDPLTEKYDLDEDKDIKWQRTSTILEDTRRVWEEMEAETATVSNSYHFSETDAADILEEGCAGGVCSLSNKPEGTGDAIGKVISAAPILVKTPIRTIRKTGDVKEIYSYIRDNKLDTVPREAAMKDIKDKFANGDRDIEKIYEDAIMSSKSVEVDASYGYQAPVTRSVDVMDQLNEGYEELVKLGIV